jgi:hypothetical protein
MPFRGIKDGTLVVPAMVANQEPVMCPGCRETMYVRGGGDRARHFYHIDQDRPGGGGCSGPTEGESAVHARCVALAVAALVETFASQAASYGAEVLLDVTDTASPQTERRADALLEFETRNPYFGAGIIIEVQHRHQDKNTRLATHDYLSQGYSVAWIPSESFGDEALDYAVVDAAFRTDGEGYSVREYRPQQFVTCEAYYYNSEHRWATVPSSVLTVEEAYEVCLGRECSLRRLYNEHESEYVYNAAEITPPDLPLRVLRDAIILRVSDDIEERFRQRYPEAPLEKALAARSEIEACPGPKGFHEWTEPGSAWESWGGNKRVRLKACQHCPVHLLADLRGRESEHEYILFSEAPDPDWDLMSLESDPRQCSNERHDEAMFWYESCPDCGVKDP